MLNPGILYICATPIGNFEDLSFRAKNILSEVDLIAAEDTRKALDLLQHYKIKKKIVSFHKFNSRKTCSLLLDKIKAGESIALISDAGTPCISDPGYEIVEEAHKQNIKVVAIPGPSSVTTAISVSGLNIKEYKFLGFLPKKEKEIEEILITNTNETIVFFESPLRIKKTLSKIEKLLPNSVIFIGRELTKKFETYYFGTSKIKEKGEFVVVIQPKKKEKNQDHTIALKLAKDLINTGGKKKDICKIIGKYFDISSKDLYNSTLEQ